MHGSSDWASSKQAIIIGGGMAGLASALTLARSGREVLIVERDPAPPQLAPGDAFEHWKRPGVPQLRHTHIFLGRFQTTLREHHPELFAELLEAGAAVGSADQSVPEPLIPHFGSRPSDRDCFHMWCRRATVEYVLRRHVGRLPNVRFLHGVTVEGLIIERGGDDLWVHGIEVRDAHGTHELRGEFVIDASGSRSKYVELLNSHGAQIRTERMRSECGYYCRHFRQRDLANEPPRRGHGSTLDYLVYGVFFAEDGHFSIAFACPELEPELLSALKRAEGFDQVCGRIPAVARWTNHADPVSRVLGGAELQNRWHHFATASGARVLGFFPVGDSYIQTNPIYGRGCSSAFVQAHALAGALANAPDPALRAARYHAEVWRLMRDHFLFCTSADGAFIARAKHVRGERMSSRQWIASRAFESAFLPAVEESPFIAREWWKMQQMSKASPPSVFLLFILQIAFLWCARLLAGRRWKPPVLGPPRDELLAALHRLHVAELPVAAAEPEH